VGRGLLEQKAHHMLACFSQAWKTGSDAHIPVAHVSITITEHIQFSFSMFYQPLGDLYAIEHGEDGRRFYQSH